MVKTEGRGGQSGVWRERMEGSRGLKREERVGGVVGEKGDSKKSVVYLLFQFLNCWSVGEGNNEGKRVIVTRVGALQPAQPLFSRVLGWSGSPKPNVVLDLSWIDIV